MTAAVLHTTEVARHRAEAVRMTAAALIEAVHQASGEALHQEATEAVPTHQEVRAATAEAAHHQEVTEDNHQTPLLL